MKQTLTAKRLREIASYDPETGLFWWLEPKRGRRLDIPAGGPVPPRGYTRIHIDGQKHYAHRLAWLFSYGRWPTLHIDHINGITDDNRLSNLREATHSQNLANTSRRKSNTSGLKGIHRHCDGRWRAQLQVRNRRIHVGVFASIEDARLAYVRAAKEHFGTFAKII